jgi:hypothetical protein
MEARTSGWTGNDWRAGQLVSFRFAFAYLLLYSFPFPEGFLPGTFWLTDAFWRLWYGIDVWVAAHVLGLGHAISTDETGSGDRACDYVRLLCVFALAVVVTVVWSLADRRRRNYDRLHEWLLIYLRYVLAFTMLLYGVVKLAGGQFFPPSLLRLTETYGQSSPQSLLWTFMGASASYTFFAGALETIGGVLLYFRRTATLGALIVMSVLANVVMVNFCYDVPVKQYSLHLLVMTAVLLGPDVRRLADFFLLHRAARLPERPLRFSSARLELAARGAKVLLIGSALYRTTTLAWGAVHAYGPLAQKHPLHGYYEVEEFVRNGEVVPPLLTDASRWRTLIVASHGFVALRAMNDSKKHFQLAMDMPEGKFALSSNHGARVDELDYTRPDPEHLVLEGRFDGDPIVVRLKRIDERAFPLVTRGFRWIKEYSD